MKTLFDERGMLNISDLVNEQPAYKAIMEDGIVTDEEIRQQSEATIASLRHLESICNQEQQNAIVEAISHLGVLFTVYQKYQQQNKK